MPKGQKTAEQLVNEFKEGVTELRFGFKKLIGIAEELERVSIKSRSRMTQANARASRRVIGATLHGLDHLSSIDMAYRKDEDRRKEDEAREKRTREAAQKILEERRRKRDEEEAAIAAEEIAKVDEDVDEEILVELVKKSKDKSDLDEGA